MRMALLCGLLGTSACLASEVVHFEFNSAELTAEAKSTLEEAHEADPGEGLIEVIGHSDSKGDAYYNLDLSYRRARAVVVQLVELGTDLKRFRIVSRGALEPAGSNKSKSGRQKNRRVAVRFLAQEESRQVATADEQAMKTKEEKREEREAKEAAACAPAPTPVVQATPAPTLAPTPMPVLAVTPVPKNDPDKRWRAALGVAMLPGQYLPHVALTRRFNNHLAFGGMFARLATASADDAVRATSYQLFLTGTYFLRETYQGPLVEVGLGAASSSARTPLGNNSATSFALMAQAGWMERWAGPFDVAIYAGARYLSGGIASANVISLFGLSPMLSVQVGYRF